MESKSFDLIKEADTNGICIIERGKIFLSSITLGKEGAIWFQSLMVKVATSSPDKQILKTFKEANKVFVCHKQSNVRGHFVSLKEYGASRNKGFVVIPEGRDLWGWHGFSQVLTGLLNPGRNSGKQPAAAIESRRRSSQFRDRHSDNQVQRRSFKEAVNQGANIAISLPNIAGKSIGNSMGWSDKSNVNEFEISLKLILGFGPNGSWEVKWAGPADNHNGPHHAQQKPATGKAQPKTAQRQNQVWKPWAGSQTLKPNPSPTTLTKPDPAPIFQWNPDFSPGASTSNVDPEPSCPCDEALIQFGVLASAPSYSSKLALALTQSDELNLALLDLDRTWGTSNEWFIDLRDGRRLRLPLDTNNQWWVSTVWKTKILLHKNSFNG